MEIQTSETIETSNKKERDWQELHAKLEEYEPIAQERDERKRRHGELQITLKEKNNKTPKGLVNSEGGPDVTRGLGNDELG